MMLMMLAEMPMEDDETILRGEEGISSHGAVREPAPLCGVTGIPAFSRS